MSITDWTGRLTTIGASANELSAITAAYYATTADEQAALDTLIAGLANADLLVMLTTWRTSGSPFQAGYPGGSLPFGTGTPVLTGDPADDANAISAGTGIPIPALTATPQTLAVSGLISAPAILILGDANGQTGPLLLAGTLPGTGVPTSGTFPTPQVAELIAANPVLATVPTAYPDAAGNWQFNTSPGSPGLWNYASPATLPVISGATADTVTSTSARLLGVINPEGLVTGYQFQIGTDTSYGLPPVPTPLPTPMAVSDSNPDLVVATVTGLQPGIEYFVQLVAVNAAGPALSGGAFTFQTLPSPTSVPTITIVGTSLVTQTTATLTATIVPNDDLAEYYFEYGTTSSYGTQVPAGPTFGQISTSSPFAPVTVTANLTALPPNAATHWRVQASNSAGSAPASADQTFSTKNATAPTAVTQAATSPTINGATLNGSSNPEGNATGFHFDLGLASGNYSLGKFPGTDATVGSGSSPVSVSQAVTGLASGVQHFFRLVTHSTAGGTTLGPELTFTTSVITGNLSPWRSGVAAGGTFAGYSLLEGSLPALTVIPAPAQLTGPHALQIVCSDKEMTDAPVSGRTRDVNEPAVSACGPQHEFVSGSEGFAMWDFVLPTNFPKMVAANWLLLGEFHGPFLVGGVDVWEAGAQFASPATALRCALVNGQEVVGLWRAYPDYKMLCSWPLVRGVRNQIIVHMIFSPNPTVGLREAWLNGVQATFLDGTKTLKDTTLFQDSQGNTQRLTMFQMVYMNKNGYGAVNPVTVIFGDSAVGPTFASVQ